MASKRASANEKLHSPIGYAASFWEPQRLLYNLILAAIAFGWIVFTWPHFRPALTLPALQATAGLAFLANLCYSAAYFADLAGQHFAPTRISNSSRWMLWSSGTIFAILLENYWIADEIYADVAAGAAFSQSASAAATHIATNVNFPASLAAIAFLAAIAGCFLALLSMLVAWFSRKTDLVRNITKFLACGAAIYFALLLGFSLASHTTELARSQEKYFCEIDCHLAYSLLDVQRLPAGNSSRHLLTVRTRFDETTISASRPKDVPLTPAPRTVYLIDANGNRYLPIETRGTPLLTPLTPADFYTTQFIFEVPQSARNLRLLITTAPAFPDLFVIGDENSLLHKKTYFVL